ncbi:MAG: signal peptide peptidase SppA [Enterococcus sp.]
MNSRRWLAVGIAAGLLVVSLVTSSLTQKMNEAISTPDLSSIFSENEMQPVVIEDGDDSKKIAQLSVDGTIISGGTSSLFSSEGYNHEEFMDQLEAIEEDDSVKGILLEVNSPGGGVYESAEIARELTKIQSERKIPLYVSMKNTAASGGYYISANADKIYATEETVTGSIGVIMSSLNYSGLLEKLGVEDTTTKSGALKDIGSSTREPTTEDEEVLQAYVDSAYNRFVKVVSTGREQSEAEVKKLADGRIYDGVQAKEVGLVDEIGFPEDALDALRSEHDLQDAQLVVYETPVSGFASTWLGAKITEFQEMKASESSKIVSALSSMGMTNSPRAMYFYGGE